MGVFGTLVQGALGGFPEKPDVPRAPFVDPQSAQQTAISGNYSALPELERLGRGVDKYNLSQRLQMLSQGIPGFTDIREAGSDALLSQLRGEIPQDVGDELQRNANARAFAGGYGGSGMAGNLTARDFGRTSMDLINRGQAVAPGWLGTLGSLLPEQFNVQSGFLSPSEQINAGQWNETMRYNRDWLQNKLDSLPDPETAAIAESVGGLTDMVAAAALAWAGGGIGGAIGGAGGGMIGSQLGGMFGGGGTPQSSDIGAIIGSAWTPTAATTPATPMYQPYQTVDPLGVYNPGMVGGYQMNYGGFF